LYIAFFTPWFPWFNIAHAQRLTQHYGCCCPSQLFGSAAYLLHLLPLLQRLPRLHRTVAHFIYTVRTYHICRFAYPLVTRLLLPQFTRLTVVPLTRLRFLRFACSPVTRFTVLHCLYLAVPCPLPRCGLRLTLTAAGCPFAGWLRGWVTRVVRTQPRTLHAPLPLCYPLRTI